MTYTYAEFCAGYGGLGLAVEEVFGAELKWYSEFEAAPSKIMAHHWPGVPNHGDMTTIDFTQVERVDILSGGTPCQDLSHAGRRAGMRSGTRSGLWESMREAIATIKPTYVVWENVRGAYSAGADSAMEQCQGCMGEAGDGQPILRALGRVLGDLADLGFDAEWRGLRAADVGAPHGRFRVFILAANRNHIGSNRGREWAKQDGRGQPADGGDATAHANSRDDAGREQNQERAAEWGTAAERSSGSRNRGEATANADSPSREALSGRPGAGDAGRLESLVNSGPDSGGINWGPYAPVIRRWEAVRGTAPSPTELTPKGKHRLSAKFAEWMMGVDSGWITDVPDVSRNDQLKAAGNGVVPQQAAAALRDMTGVHND